MGLEPNKDGIVSVPHILESLKMHINTFITFLFEKNSRKIIHCGVVNWGRGSCGGLGMVKLN